MVLEIFKIVHRLRNRHVFAYQSLEILNVFSTLILKNIFGKTKTFFEKLANQFLVESTKNENATFPHKTTLSEANVKQMEWGVQNHKERSFPL